MRKRGEQIQAEVLSVLHRSRGPISAYDVLEMLRKTNPKIAPTTIYRALKALAERGYVHRLESLNAFVACQSKDACRAAVLSVCDKCGVVEECAAPEVLRALDAVVGESGFQPTRKVIEVHGACAACTITREATL